MRTHDSRRHADAGARPPRGPLALVVLATALFSGFLLFAALGAWQVQRLHWKHDLIARVDARIHAAPAPAPGAIAGPPARHASRNTAGSPCMAPGWPATTPAPWP